MRICAKDLASILAPTVLVVPKKVSEWAKKVAAKNKNEIWFVAIDTNTNRPVGSCSFNAKETGRTRHRGEIGWFVHFNYWGRGIATKLVRAVLKEAKRRGFKKAMAEVAITNIASVRLAKRCGFKIEGRIKDGLLLDNGRYIATYMVGKNLK